MSDAVPLAVEGEVIAKSEADLFQEKIGSIISDNATWTITADELSVSMTFTDGGVDGVGEITRVCNEKELYACEVQITRRRSPSEEEKDFVKILRKAKKCKDLAVRAAQYGVRNFRFHKITRHQIECYAEGDFNEDESDLGSQVEEINATEEALGKESDKLKLVMRQMEELHVSPFLIKQVGSVLPEEGKRDEKSLVEYCNMAIRMIRCLSPGDSVIRERVKGFNQSTGRKCSNDYVRGLKFMDHISKHDFKEGLDHREQSIPKIQEFNDLGYNIIFIKTENLGQTMRVVAPVIGDVMGNILCITEKNLIFCRRNNNFSVTLQNIIDPPEGSKLDASEKFIFVHPENLDPQEQERLADACMMRVNDIQNNSYPQFIIITSYSGLIPGGIPERATIYLSTEDMKRLCWKNRQYTGFNFIRSYASEKAGDGKGEEIRKDMAGKECDHVFVDLTARDLPDFTGDTYHVEVAPAHFDNQCEFFDKFWLATFYHGYVRSDGMVVPMCSPKYFYFEIPQLTEKQLPQSSLH